MRASSSVIMICWFSVAPMPPYCLGQCGAIQPLRDIARYQGISSAGGGRLVRPRSAAGKLASSQVRTSARNAASSDESLRNMAAGVAWVRTAISFGLDIGGLYQRGPLCALPCKHFIEILGGTDLDFGAECIEPRARLRRRKRVTECTVELDDDI